MIMEIIAGNLKGIFHETVQSALSFIFPPKCVICDEYLEEENSLGFCQSCLDELPWIKPPICPACGLPYLATPEAPDHLCGDCTRNKYAFQWARASTIYRTKIRSVIHRFKFGNRPELARALVKTLFVNETVFRDVPQADSIVPVPLHRERLRRRGYNQALLLAKSLGNEINLPVECHNLRRIRKTIPQIGLGPSERKKNVRNAFRIKRPERVKGKKVFLVDDVYTTGNTLNECARTLREAGSESVFAVTICRVSLFETSFNEI